MTEGTLTIYTAATMTSVTLVSHTNQGHWYMATLTKEPPPPSLKIMNHYHQANTNGTMRLGR